MNEAEAETCARARSEVELMSRLFETPRFYRRALSAGCNAGMKDPISEIKFSAAMRYDGFQLNFIRRRRRNDVPL